MKRNILVFDVESTSLYGEACSLIPKDATINRMGGFKCYSEGIEVDVWTGDMNDFAASNYFKFAFHPKTGVRIVKVSPHEK